MTPAFGREVFQHNIKTNIPNMGYDDTYTMNTQSSTQWDGFRHVSSHNGTVSKNSTSV
jgi:hypothetical protein